jgi:hypothetical protein
MIAGPYMGQPHHHCLGVRMWDRFFDSDVNEESSNPTCFEQCPKQPVGSEPVRLSTAQWSIIDDVA